MQVFKTSFKQFLSCTRLVDSRPPFKYAQIFAALKFTEWKCVREILTVLK